MMKNIKIVGKADSITLGQVVTGTICRSTCDEMVIASSCIWQQVQGQRHIGKQQAPQLSVISPKQL